MDEKKKFEISDDMLENVAGGHTKIPSMSSGR